MKKLILASLVALMAGLASAQTTFFPNFPSTSSSTVSNWLQRSTLTLEEEFHQDVDNNRFDYEHTDIQYKYSAFQWLDLFGSYRLVYQDKGSGWKQANQVVPGFWFHASPWLDPKYGAFNVRSRVIITLQDSNNKASYQDQEWFKYSLPWKFTKYQLSPFVGDEVIFDCQNSMNVIKNRITAGFDYQLTSHIVGTLMYWDQTTRGKSGWSQDNLFVAQIRFVF